MLKNEKMGVGGPMCVSTSGSKDLTVKRYPGFRQGADPGGPDQGVDTWE